MKKICFMLTLIAFNLVGSAQNLDDINDMLGKKEYKKAKDGIDKFLSDSKNASKSDGWYFKGRIYNSYSRDSSLNMKDAMQYKMDAFEAFKKSQQLDKFDIRLLAEGHVSFFDLYNGFFELAAKAYTNQNFEGAFKGFSTALIIEDYVRLKDYSANGFKFPKMDTSLVLNTAITARQAKKEEEAVKYYKMLVDADISGQSYLEAYSYLAEYYNNKKDANAFAAIAAKGKNFYPAEPYWEVAYYDIVEIENAIKGLKGEELLKKYDELLIKYPENFAANYNYSVELYKYIYSQDIKPADVPSYKTKFEVTLKKAIALKSTAENNFLMANFLYNNSFDLSDESKKVKGVKPEDVKKRNDFSNAAKKCMDDCIPYGEAAIRLYEKLPKLKSVEKTNFKQTCDILSEIYRVKGEAKKSADYKAKKDAL